MGFLQLTQFLKGRNNRVDSFRSWFSEEFLSTVVWTLQTNRVYRSTEVVAFADTKIAKLLQGID